MLETRSFDHMLGITYVEHGGCYDHVAPPTNAVPPDDDAGEFGYQALRPARADGAGVAADCGRYRLQGAGELTIRYKALQCPLHQGADGAWKASRKK